MTTTKTKLLNTIRKHCLNCCSGSFLDVKNCTSGPNAEPDSQCALWAFRLGTDPEEASEAMKAKGRKISAKLRVLKETPETKRIIKIRTKTQRYDVIKSEETPERVALKVNSQITA
jgi:hypothetical protein